jgi:transcriptional regulator with XRE-family HTH domain
LPKGIHDQRYRWLLKRLVAARKAAGLSQSDVADLLGKPQQFVSRYELGERRLDVFEFVDVATTLGLSPTDELRNATDLKHFQIEH